jgi:L-lactate dehydrogenase
MPPGNTKLGFKIAVVGVGQVGAAVAYALILGSVACELLLVDVKVDLRDGQVLDLLDAAYSRNSQTRVRAATFQEASQCDIVVITVGSKYVPGKRSDGRKLITCCPEDASSREHLGQPGIEKLYHSIAVVGSAVKAMKPFRSDTILLLVSNPIDLVTTFAQGLSGLPRSQVLGSGTFLDSVRLRGLLADKTGVRAYNP